VFEMPEKPGDRKKVFELTEVYEEKSAGVSPTQTGAKTGGNLVVIDGRVYEKVNVSSAVLYDLTDVIEERVTASDVQDAVIRQVRETAERIARELVPGIVERIVREEIEKLRK